MWIELEDVLSVCRLAKQGDWSWINNSLCKYIEVRIDMRDGRCLLRDRDGDPLTLEELKHQYSIEKQSERPEDKVSDEQDIINKQVKAWKLEVSRLIDLILFIEKKKEHASLNITSALNAIIEAEECFQYPATVDELYKHFPIIKGCLSHYHISPTVDCGPGKPIVTAQMKADAEKINSAKIEMEIALLNPSRDLAHKGDSNA